MSPSQHDNVRPLIAVDVGNTRTKFGLFAPTADNEAGLPTPETTLDFSGQLTEFDELANWIAPRRVDEIDWRIASVNRPAGTRLIDWLREQGAADQTRLVTSRDLPLRIELPRPDMVGIDRLLGAAGANLLRAASRPAVVVDLGTAITIDLVSAEGAFLGGAILPGIGLAARALHEFTDALPLLRMDALSQPPEPLGKSTVDAMQSGLFWGAVGASRELIAQFAAAQSSQPDVFLTGGAGASVAPLLAADCRHVPHLILGAMASAVRGID